MSGLRGDPRKLADLAKRIAGLPRVIGHRVAERSASTIAALARGTFAAGQTAYGDAWAPGVDGQQVTLRRTGALAGGVRYVAIGTTLRASLGPRYAKYQVGKRPVFPRRGATLPSGYSAALEAAARTEMRLTEMRLRLEVQ